jgi:hypothetical protein
LLCAALTIVDPTSCGGATDALHKRRLQAARSEIERETERLILQRIATNLLNSSGFGGDNSCRLRRWA